MSETLLADAVQAYQSGNLASARNMLTEAVADYPEDARFHALLGVASGGLFEYDAAREALKKAVELDPDNNEYRTNYGRMLIYSGAFNEAEKQFRAAIALNPESPSAYYYLTQIVDLPAEDPAISALETIAEGPLGDEHKAMAKFALGKIFDRLGEYDAAFAHYQRANQLTPATYDHGAVTKFYDAFKQVFTRDFLESRRDGGNQTRDVIFIVGMPRSGSTLVEELLARHDGVAGLGERAEMARIVGAISRHHPQGYPAGAATMTDEHYRGFADKYLEEIKPRAQEASRYVDKNLRNFQHLGFIRTAFPKAPVIHTRRHPAAACLSAYFQFFQDEPSAFDFDNLAARYAAYQDLMQYWESVFPEPLHTIDYEDVVKDRDATVKQLRNIAGIADDASQDMDEAAKRDIITSSAWQVRQPVYDQAINHWRNYEKHLGPLFEAFERHGVKLPD
ncbi:tetratricopeptide repeat-containing sulfotransferase family protein [Hyphococcus sp.]|uniref:tetratricopeptide repeat-containing sulfotransferase family protein n=1 Tax=Hyphococcus sp. TaxID=2038636 RepID=UPI0035C74F90